MSSTTATSNVLILGMAKTGTSALYTAVRNARQSLSIYEIGKLIQIRYLAERGESDRVSKMLIPKYDQLRPDLSSFTHLVRVVRDPRDVVVSWLLFRPFLHGNWKNREYIEELVDLLQHKESDPRAVSLADLRELFERNNVRWVPPRQFREWIKMEDRFARENSSAVTVRYEDFLVDAGELLQDYLGLPVDSEVELGTYNAFNQRARSSGGWRNWFTDRDIEEYAPVFDDYLRRYRYDTDWDLAESPSIDPSTSSEHVVRNVERLRRHPPPSGWLAEDLSRYSESYIKSLKSAMLDGREPAMIEYALLLRLGLGVQADGEQSRAILQDVAARGNRIAYAHLVADFEAGLGGPRDEAAAERAVKQLRESEIPSSRLARYLQRARAVQTMARA